MNASQFVTSGSYTTHRKLVYTQRVLNYDQLKGRPRDFLYHFCIDFGLKEYL
jgi:hypothetical protein